MEIMKGSIGFWDSTSIMENHMEKIEHEMEMGTIAAHMA